MLVSGVQQSDSVIHLSVSLSCALSLSLSHYIYSHPVSEKYSLLILLASQSFICLQVIHSPIWTPSISDALIQSLRYSPICRKQWLFTNYGWQGNGNLLRRRIRNALSISFCRKDLLPITIPKKPLEKPVGQRKVSMLDILQPWQRLRSIPEGSIREDI